MASKGKEILSYDVSENGDTKISIKKLSGENTAPFYYIPQWWMDEFMAQKLDALPVDAETDKAAGQK